MCFPCSAVVSVRRSKTLPPGFSSVSLGFEPGLALGSLLLALADFGLSLLSFAFGASCFVAVVGLGLGVSCFPLVLVPLSDVFAPSVDWTGTLVAEVGVTGVEGVKATSSGGGAIVCTHNHRN